MSTTTIDIGDQVQCDICSKDFTGKTDPGGFLFGSKGVCPECAPRYEELVKKCNEEHFIKARCPPGMPFAAWILKLRGGDNTVTLHSVD